MKQNHKVSKELCVHHRREYENADDARKQIKTWANKSEQSFHEHLQIIIKEPMIVTVFKQRGTKWPPRQKADAE